MVEQFEKEAKKSSNVNRNQFWRQDNRPIELWSNKVIAEKINYIHKNPVEEGLVSYSGYYVCSSVRDYAGKLGALDGINIADLYF